MKRAILAGALVAAAIALALVLLLATPGGGPAGNGTPGATSSPPAGPASARPDAPPSAPAAGRGFLYGRVTTEGGEVYEGRLRWGGGEEAFWTDTFYGTKKGNPWVAYVAADQLPTRRRPFRIFGIELFEREPVPDVSRPFMARFGDIARIEGRGNEVRVTLKSGTVVVIDRMGANDFDDGVRVWDRERGVVNLESGIEDLGSHRIRSIELLPTPATRGELPDRLHGTVRTRSGTFEGFLQWDREEGVGTDTLDGQGPDGQDVAVPFESIRTIARRPSEGVLVSLKDGRDVALVEGPDVDSRNRGIYVDDERFGRVLVSWEAFESVELTAAGSGPGYADFPPGQPLAGRVVTRDGRSLSGRLVFDLDESESTETLDAPSGGIDYTIPFGRIASLSLPRAAASADARVKVALHGGQTLALEPAGDLAATNGGMLVFVDGREHPHYVPWTEVAALELEPPPAPLPPLDRM